MNDIENEVDVPDSIRPYLNEIAERLWAERAAVMVGAGFSKNAGNGFPDWNQLGEFFYQRAHGVKADPAKQKYLNVLRLAEEVQVAIGRPALENLLRSNISDLNIEPSGLHVELLELPWVDVFTTNYDTLLERASAKVVTRRYEPVVNKEDLPYAIKPRIVKLHGSFPSERPFIITEEDYRRYPHDYAPFVNTVQQALLENTFCLIGFSGDDPNFLQWIGWIRDNLGRDKTQKIYLVGVFDLSAARLQLLAQRGIIVVDLSCCDGIEKHDHRKVLSRFFKYIRAKKPDALDWPYNPKAMHPTHGADRIQEIQKVTDEWQRQRQVYPGWLILPHSNRETLWVYTDTWVNYLPDTETPPGLDIQYAFELIWRLERCLLPVFDNIAEFCEKILAKYWPFQNENPPTNCQFHPGDNKFQDLPWNDLRQAWLGIAVAMLRFYREEGHLDKWKESEIRLRTLSDHFSAEQKEFLNYEGFLFSLFTLDLPNAKHRLENWRPNEAQPYWMTKRAACLAEIGEINDTDEQILWALVESRKKSDDQDTSTGYLSVSEESYQMLLFRHVKDASRWGAENITTYEEEQLIREDLANEWSQREKWSESERQSSITVKSSENFTSFEQDWIDLYANREQVSRKPEWDQRLRRVRNNQRRNELQQQNARWDELKAFRCDPWNELKLYELKLDRPSVQRKSLTEKREFDIGRVSRTSHFLGVDQEIINAYSFLRFCEEVGLPYRVGNYTMATKTALASLQRISKFSSFWAIATLARLGDAKAVDSLFSRESVYRFTANEADQLIQNYLDTLNKCRDEIHAGSAFRNDSYGVRLAQFLPEVISRLCCKCSGETKRRVLEFVTGIYASPDKTNYRNVKNLLNRLISSMTEVEQYSLIPDLLEIPYPEDLNLLVKDEFLNPFLLLELNQKPECAPAVAIQPELVDQLFRQAALDNSDRRRWAITSLVTLHTLQLLDESQSKNLAEAIWRVTDQYGLPDGTDFYKFAFLRFPYPKGVDPTCLFKSYVKSTPFPIQRDEPGTGVRMTGGDISIVHEIIGANNDGESIWTAEDAAEILQRLLEWWDADKNRLNEKENEPAGLLSSIPEEFLARFSRMLELLAEVVCPKLSTDSPDEIEISLSRLLKEVREYGLPGLKAEAASLHIYPDQKGDVYNRINEALISNQYLIQRDGLRAIARIILDGNNAVASSVEPDPASMLSQYLTWCPAHAIISALWIIVRILKESPTIFDHSLEVATQRRLDRLLAESAYDSDSQFLNFDERLEVRRVSSILSAALLKYYESKGTSVPEVIEKWKELALAPDEFAEIRTPWFD
ncbi:anti-phage defense-associated sirtuin Dsr2 [Halomonas sp. 11-S5]|uniref:anti-phage defense-associated sirtuin Dsr2 n=1 Tax=Halomonas sp. 11-S5 TaxID=2994064 RepID=UPI002469A5D6|nr:anti-phage defense-associated sirtuin Dsr2 [Halomonas sp. 11-S5]